MTTSNPATSKPAPSATTPTAAPVNRDDHVAIRTTLARYCQSCDDGRFEEFGELFEPDARFTVMGRTHSGREAIRTWMENAQRPEARGKHMISEPLIELAPLDPSDPPVAAVTTDYAFIAPGADGLAITSCGRYVDTMARSTDGVWRFRSREIVFLVDPTG